MSVASQFSGGGIKSIQRGTIVLNSSATATITAVNTAKTMLNFCGCADGYNVPNTSSGGVNIRLTSSTQITATAFVLNFSVSYPATVSYEVIEFY